MSLKMKRLENYPKNQNNFILSYLGLLSMWFKGLIATATRMYDPRTLLGGIEMALYVLLNDCYHSNFCTEDVEDNRLCT